MKAKGIICLAVLICAAVGAVFWLDLAHDPGPANDTPTVKGSSPETNEVAWEFKTVERQESPDQAERQRQLRQQMQDFEREGWLVVSFSAPLPQADGTLHRKYEVKRVRQ